MAEAMPDLAQAVRAFATSFPARSRAAKDPTAPIVYFVAFGADFVKIGKSTRGNLEWRLKMLQLAHPLQLEVVCIVDAPERVYHQRFAEHRERGEWFRAAPEVLAAMREIHENMAGADLVLCMDLSGAFGEGDE